MTRAHRVPRPRLNHAPTRIPAVAGAALPSGRWCPGYTRNSRPPVGRQVHHGGGPSLGAADARIRVRRGRSLVVIEACYRLRYSQVALGDANGSTNLDSLPVSGRVSGRLWGIRNDAAVHQYGSDHSTPYARPLNSNKAAGSGRRSRRPECTQLVHK